MAEKSLKSCNTEKMIITLQVDYSISGQHADKKVLSDINADKKVLSDINATVIQKQFKVVPTCHTVTSQ